MKEVKIFSLLFLPQANQFVVTLLDESVSRIIPIWIGFPEGKFLHMKMKGSKSPRPLTHDLIENILESLGTKINKVVITDLKDNTYFAILELKSNEKYYLFDARPSDALILAVANKTPIFVEEKVLESCPFIPKPITQADVDKFSSELYKMTPEQFFKMLEKGE